MAIKLLITQQTKQIATLNIAVKVISQQVYKA